MTDSLALTDPALEPSSELITAALGAAMPAWERLLASATGPELGLATSWRFYTDQGAWLAKALRGQKNLAWLSVWRGHGRMTFYFAQRHREALEALDLDPGLRRQIATQPMVGRMLPVPVDIRTDSDVDDALAVLRFKMAAT